MNSNPLISIITPTYNHQKYLSDCIDSVRMQTYPNWEMILIDDGSTDNTNQIGKLFSSQDERIKLMNQENIGIFRLAETYNRALDAARGKYIAIIEGDDIWEPSKLEKQIIVMEKNEETVMSWSRAQTIKENTGLLQASYAKESLAVRKYFNNDPTGSILNVLLLKNPIPAVTIMIRKSALLRINGFQQGYGLPLVDLPTYLELAKLGPFHFDDECFGKWRIYSSQATKTYPVEILKGCWALSLHHFAHLDRKQKINVSLTRQKINRHYTNQLQIAFARSGRYKLIRKDFSGARKDYFQVLFYKGMRNPLWRLRALIGILISFFKRDVEGLSRFLGRASYQ